MLPRPSRPAFGRLCERALTPLSFVGGRSRARRFRTGFPAWCLASGHFAKPFGLRPHATILRVGVVVVPEEMEETVREEHRDFLQDSDAARKSLLPSRFNADNDVAENALCERSKLPFLHRKSQDIGRAIFSTIDSVELVHSFVVS